MTQAAIAEWHPSADPAAEIEQLAQVLHAAVHAGASVSFVLPFPMEEARAFWRDQILPAVQSGARRILLAQVEGRIIGTVQILLDTPPNQAHRAEVAKLLVHPDARRLGIARALMAALEEIAVAEGRTLLTLDTRTGDRAEPLYLSMDYVAAGVIPGYARGPSDPQLEATTFMYKELRK
jgi:GNAT superfamily N-acetyltransferase